MSPPGARLLPTGAVALRRSLVVVMLLLMAATSGCGADPAQVRLCERVARALEDKAASVEVIHAARHPHVEHAVIVDYRVTDAAGESASHWISCRFSGASLAAGPQTLVGVTTGREGALSPVRMAMLQIWLRLSDRGAARLPAEQPSALGPPVDSPAYFIQQVVNAIPLASVYTLIAIGFSLVYGVIGRINLAFGDLASVAGYTTFLGMALLVIISAERFVVAIAAVLLLAAAVSGLYGWVTQRVIFRPLQLPVAGASASGIGSQTALIATLGLAILLRETMRLAGSSRDHWLQPVFTTTRALVDSDGFFATINWAQLIIFAVTSTVVAGVSLVMTESRFGRRYRACCDDLELAALAGVDVDRVVGWAFVLGAASAGVAGTIIALYYGTVSAYMGTLIGFKALSAAVIGGLGSVAGAVIGGLFVAVFETMWAAYLSGDYRDIGVFGLLAVFLVLRPRGLFGR